MQREFHLFLNEMHVQIAIQMFPSNKTCLTVGATMLRHLPGTQSPTDSTKIFPCTVFHSHEALTFSSGLKDSAAGLNVLL